MVTRAPPPPPQRLRYRFHRLEHDGGRAECTPNVASGCNLRRPLRGQALTNDEIEINKLDDTKASS